AVYDFLVSRGVQPGTIVPYGRSIGSGAASFLANQRHVAGLILVQPLTSTLDMGRKAYPYLPIRLLLTERIDNTVELARYEAPLLILHGDCDEVVPYSMGQELFRNAVSPDKRMVTLEGGDHNFIGTTHGAQIIDAVSEWLDHLSPSNRSE
ncbi:MAG: alpha/beta hydrolase, partial [Planctomycetota bacterium]